MKVRNFINYTLISLIYFCGFIVLNKFQLGFYGLAWGSLVFGAIFIFLGLYELGSKKKRLAAIEYFGLTVIAIIFFCKGWIILFKGLNLIYLIGLIIMVSINVWNTRQIVQQKSDSDRNTYLIRIVLRGGLILFFVTEILYVLNVSGYIYLAVISILISALTFLTIVKIQFSYFRKHQTLKSLIAIDNFNSYWLLLGFILFFSYRVSVHYELTDEVVFRRLPPEYVDLFYQAENGNEEPIDGKYEYELYLENYQEFMDEYVRTEDR